MTLNFSTCVGLFISDSAHAHQLTNHPAHLVQEGGKLAPSAFIPFCELGGQPDLLGGRPQY